MTRAHGLAGRLVSHTMNASFPSPPLTIITHEFFPMKGGIATFVEEMARACHDLGQKVDVWAPQSAMAFERPLPYPVKRVRLRGTQDLSCQFRMAREMIANRRRLRRGMVYLPEPGPLLAMTYLQFFKAFKPGRLLLTFHGSEVRSFSARPAARMLVGRLIGVADRVTTPSKFTRSLLCEHFPSAEAKTVITPGALRADFVGRDTARMKTTDKIVIVTVGRLHPRKGQLHILEALNALPSALHDKIEYWIIGRSVRGNYEAQLRRRASTSSVPVTFLGNIDDDDLDTIYRRADIFAMTSVNHGYSVEGFGLVYLEASAFGLPVIGHAVGGVAEAVRDGETGLLVPPGDREALTSALEKLINDAALRERMGAAGRIWARKHSWQDSARILLDGLVNVRRRKSPALQSA